MQHALILEDDVAVSTLIEERLSEYGFSSFVHAWSRNDAERLARVKRPDLVIVCAIADARWGIGAAQAISERYGTPALLVTAGSGLLKERLPTGCSLGGPFPMPELHSAIAAARPS
jgi:DNA-binding response OmpR family regulator